MSTTIETPIPAIPTTATAEAAQVVQDLVERLASIDDRPALRARLHEAARTLQRALNAGASIHDLVEYLVTATAPPEAPPPFQPWAPILSMTFAAFAQAGVALHVTLPALGESIWLASDEVIQAAVVRETGLWHRFVKDIGWVFFEADRLKLPEDQRTVGRFIEALDGVVVGWRAQEEEAPPR